jgi:hypothetical protein
MGKSSRSRRSLGRCEEFTNGGTLLPTSLAPSWGRGLFLCRCFTVDFYCLHGDIIDIERCSNQLYSNRRYRKHASIQDESNTTTSTHTSNRSRTAQPYANFRHLTQQPSSCNCIFADHLWLIVSVALHYISNNQRHVLRYAGSFCVYTA